MHASTLQSVWVFLSCVNAFIIARDIPAVSAMFIYASDKARVVVPRPPPDCNIAGQDGGLSNEFPKS